MLPVLLDLKFIKIYTFGVFLVLAFFWSLFWLWKNLKRTSFQEVEVFDGVFLSLFGGFLMARIVHVILHFDRFGFDVLKFILINGYPGLSLIGFIGGFLTVLWIFTRVVKLSYFEVTVYMVPSLFLALFIGHIGAFFSGSTVGTPTEFILRVPYVGYEGLRHITGLYEALWMIVGFFISQRMLMSYRRDVVHEGSILSFFIILTGISQLILDNFKADTVYLWHLPFGVWVSGIVIVIFGFLECYKYRTNIGEKVTNILALSRKK